MAKNKKTTNKYSAMYRSIDQRNLSDSAKATLKKLRLATGNFLKKDEKPYEAFELFYNRLKSNKPTAIKTTKEYIAEQKRKRSERAKESFKSRGRKEDPKRKRGVGSEEDSKRPAKRVGWRLRGRHNYKKPTQADILSGRAYYEDRVDRSDVNRKKFPMLERGGRLNEYKLRFEPQRTLGGKPVPTRREIELLEKNTMNNEVIGNYIEKFYYDFQDEMGYIIFNNELVKDVFPLILDAFNMNPILNDWYANNGSIDSLRQKVNKLEGKWIEIYSMGQSEPIMTAIESVRLSDPSYRYRTLFIDTTGGGQEVINKEENIEKFLNGEQVDFREHAIRLLPNQFAKGGEIKGSNPSTGEKFGVVIGSLKKKDGMTTLTIRSSYSSRISAFELRFNEKGYLQEIANFGYSMDGSYPDMKGSSSVESINADNKKESIDAIAQITSPSFAKKVYDYVQTEKMAKGGLTEHGLKRGDTINDDLFWENAITVKDKNGKLVKVDLEKGVRKESMAKGGRLQYRYEELDDPDAGTIFDALELKEFLYEFNEYFGTNYKNIDEFNEGEEYRKLTKVEKGGYMAKGGEVSHYKTFVNEYPNKKIYVWVEFGGASMDVQHYTANEENKKRAISFAKRLAEKNNGTYEGFEKYTYEKGGKLGFEGLAKKVAKNYEGKKVPSKYQSLYGKTYSKEEAKEVGDKIASKVYRQQISQMEHGGVIYIDEHKSGK